MNTRAIGSVLSVLAALSATTDSEAAIRYVTPPGAGSGNGTSWANASSDLGAMLNASTAGDEVWVAAGTYDPGVLPSATFTIKGGVRLFGGFAGTEALLSDRNVPANPTFLVGNDTGSGSNHHVVTATFTSSGQASVLDGFHILNGDATGAGFPPATSGGGLFLDTVFASDILVSQCVFSNCKAANGGAIYCSSAGQIEIISSVVSDNTATISGGGAMLFVAFAIVDQSIFDSNLAGSNRVQSQGGGLYANGFSRLDIVGSSFSENRAGIGSSGLVVSDLGDGGGIWALTNSDDPSLAIVIEDVVVDSCFVEGAQRQHGGAYLQAENISIERTKFARCAANNGSAGGVGVLANRLTFGNSIVAFNDAGDHAGMRFQRPNFVGNFTIYNSIFYENSSTGTGAGNSAGLYLNFPPIGASVTKVSNCILWGNAAGGSAAEGAQLRFDTLIGLTVEHSDIENLATAAILVPALQNQSVDPRFSNPTVNDDFRLLRVSPMIDTGTANADTDAAVAGIQMIGVGSIDFESKQRILGAGVDKGAIEFQCNAALTCAGDVNCDGVVNLADVALITANWGLPAAPPGSNGDADGDGQVGLADLAVVTSNWNVVCP